LLVVLHRPAGNDDWFVKFLSFFDSFCTRVSVMCVQANLAERGALAFLLAELAAAGCQCLSIFGRCVAITAHNKERLIRATYKSVSQNAHQS
jgi:hypothetical protein